MKRKLWLSAHQAVWGIAGAIDYPQCKEWYLASLNALLNSGSGCENRFYQCAFHVPEPALFDVNLSLLTQVSNSFKQHYNLDKITFLRWIYRLAHIAFVTGKNDLIRQKIFPVTSFLSENNAELCLLLTWWKSFCSSSAVITTQRNHCYSALAFSKMHFSEKRGIFRSDHRSR
jgi:hypothetical protein